MKYISYHDSRVNAIFCEDIDECGDYYNQRVDIGQENTTKGLFKIKLNDCHKFADCRNFQGGYNCTCWAQQEGNGTTCTIRDTS